jgi:nicotinic acid phosphoribosyltransferase
MSDLVWQAVMAFVVTSAIVFMLWKTIQAVRNAADNAVAQAGRVRADLADANAVTCKTLAEIKTTGVETHKLVNSAMLEQKKLYMLKCQQAQRDNPSPANEAEYRAAKQAHEEHKAKQEQMERHPP